MTYQSYDRSKIIEESIPGLPAPVIDGDTGQRIQYLRVLLSSKPKCRESGIINADQTNIRIRELRIP